ncbi:hypothetical protein F4779DRAFT_614658 [Xylariaceae sp. FL0662B]|nr:hypothetical protein F4779DRAFT_614658 [Xylariaceae sp. FL0662B]
MAHAGCYSVETKQGELWYDQDWALSLVDRYCGDGTFNGVYGANGDSSQHRKKCAWGTPDNREIGATHWHAGTKQHIIFEVWHISDGKRELGHDECVNGFNKEIRGCRTGGEREYTNWKYKYDPPSK